MLAYSCVPRPLQQPGTPPPAEKTDHEELAPATAALSAPTESSAAEAGAIIAANMVRSGLLVAVGDMLSRLFSAWLVGPRCLRRRSTRMLTPPGRVFTGVSAEECRGQGCG